MAPRVESDTPPPPRPIDVTKARVLLPVTLIVSAFVVSVGAGAALEKMPNEEDVERIAARASESAIKAAISEDTPRRLAVQHQIDELAKSHTELTKSMARLGTSVTRLEVYNEIQATSAVRPITSSPKAVQMRRNIIAGRDPLAGIVPSDTRD